MPQIINIARSVTSSLADLNAELILLPELSLNRNASQRVIVSPVATTSAPVTRNLSVERPVIRVYLLRHCLENETATAADTAAALATRLIGKTFAGSLCISLEYNPILNSAYLREENLFLASITLKFTTIN